MRFVTISGLAAFLALPLVTLPVGCASKIEPHPTDNAPGGTSLEEELDLSLVTLEDLRTGETVNVGQYMEAQGRDYLLLTFGSNPAATR